MGVNDFFGPRRKTNRMQLLTMDLGNNSLKLITTDRHILFLKTGPYMKNVGKIRPRSNVLFKIYQFQVYGVCWLRHPCQINMISGGGNIITNVI